MPKEKYPIIKKVLNDIPIKNLTDIEKINLHLANSIMTDKEKKYYWTKMNLFDNDK